MFVEVNGKEFKAALSRVVSGSKPTISLSFNKDFIFIQSRKFVIADTQVCILNSDITGNVCISVMYDSAVNMLSGDKNVHITVDEHLLTIRQDNFTWIAEEVPEDIVDVSISSNTREIVFDESGVSSLHSLSKYLLRAMKELGSTSGAFQFKGGYGYLVQENIAIKRKVGIPDCAITSESVAELVLFADKSRIVKTVMDYGNKFIKVFQENAVTITVSFSDVDDRVVDVFSQIESKARFVTETIFNRQEKYYKDFISSFSKVPVDLMLGKDGISLYVENGRVRCVVGNPDNANTSIRVTMGQLYAVLSLFYSSSNVNVKVGTSLVVLNDNVKTLIVSGILL